MFIIILAVLKQKRSEIMGGKVFSNFDVKRMDSKTFEERKIILVDILNDVGVEYRIPRHFHTKKDFGDIDIFISAAEEQLLQVAAKLLYLEEFGPFENLSDLILACPIGDRIKRTGNTLFLLCGDEEPYIVELRNCEPYKLDFLSSLYSYGDTSRLIDTLAMPLGLKLTESGLNIKYAPGKYVLVTQNFETILKILGLSAEAYYSNSNFRFVDVEQVCSWIRTSPLFQPNPFVERAKIQQSEFNAHKIIAKAFEDKAYNIIEYRDSHVLKLIANVDYALYKSVSRSIYQLQSLLNDFTATGETLQGIKKKYSKK